MDVEWIDGLNPVQSRLHILQFYFFFLNRNAEIWGRKKTDIKLLN